MTTEALVACLEAGYDPTRRGDLQARFEIATAQHSVRCEISAGGFQLLEQGDDVDLSIYCRDIELAIAIFSGQGNPVESFMAGEFYASGYLVWVFRILGAFQPQ